MSTSITILRSEDGSNCRCEVRFESMEGVGELTFLRMSPTKSIADHTVIDDARIPARPDGQINSFGHCSQNRTLN